jgi:acetate kinase
LSHAYASRDAARQLGRPVEELELVVCHLGAGASLCAVQRGRSVDTTMGMTPLEGLVMATRAGSVDPGLVLWVQQHGGLRLGHVQHALEEASGLEGLCETGDMRAVIQRRAGGDEDATLAFGVYIHRLRREIGAMAAALGHVDGLVFTGGVGEHAPEVRDAAAGVVDAPSVVVEAREDLEMAREIALLLR